VGSLFLGDEMAFQVIFNIVGHDVVRKIEHTVSY